jgi:hypothetical protein
MNTEEENKMDYEQDMKYQKYKEDEEVRAELLIKYGEVKTDE